MLNSLKMKHFFSPYSEGTNQDASIFRAWVVDGPTITTTTHVILMSTFCEYNLDFSYNLLQNVSLWSHKDKRQLCLQKQYEQSLARLACETKKATQVKTATADIREQSRQAGKISNLSLEQASWTTRYQAQRKSRENSATPSGHWTELS